MGQQQLLLVILVVIIVGISTIVAVNILGQGANNSNLDAIRQDLIRAASHAQEIWAKPVMLGGAGGDFSDSDNITPSEIFEALNIPGTPDDPDNPTQITNENGVYELNGSPEASSLSISGTARSDGTEILAFVCRDSVNGTWLFDIGPDASKPGNCN